jgi:hypothetical protein
MNWRPKWRALPRTDAGHHPDQRGGRRDGQGHAIQRRQRGGIAAAAEELNSQAELVQLVGESGDADLPAAPAKASGKAGTIPMAAPARRAPAKAVNGNGHRTPVADPAGAPRRGEIPMAGDFKDF